MNYYNIKNNIRKKIVIGTVGAIRELKQIHKIPEIISDILSDQNNLLFEWHIYGKVASDSEEYFKNFVQKLKEHDLEKYCLLKGYCDQKEIFSKINILVHLGKDEAFGRVFIEAMACGIPVIAIDSGGAKEVVKNNKTGFIIKENEHKSFSRKILKLINSKTLITEMGLKGRKDISKRFNSVEHVKSITSIYNTIL